MNLRNPFNKPEHDSVTDQLQAQKQAHDLDLQAFNGQGGEEEWATNLQQQRAELTRWQQDLAPEIQIMVYRLRNYVNIDGKWQPLVVRNQKTGRNEKVKPLCAEECIWRIVAMAQPSTSKNLMMSKYTEEQILMDLRNLHNTLDIDILLANRRRFRIRMCDLKVIHDIFHTTVKPTYFRALGANEKHYLGTVRKETSMDNQNLQAAKKKSGLFGLGV